MLKPLTMDYNKLLKILQVMRIPSASWKTCQEATIRTGHGTIDWFKIEKEVCQGYILSPCLFNLYAEYIVWNAMSNKPQAGIKIARRTINNIRYAEKTTLMAESKKELNSFLMRMKENSEKAGLKLNIKKTISIAFSLISSWQIYGGKCKQCQVLFTWAPSLWTVTAAII